MVCLESLEDRWINQRNGPAVLPGIRIEKVRHQGGHVIGSIAQRRQIDRNDVQPVVEILAKSPFVDFVEQIAIGCGHDPAVDLNRPGVADPFELVLLQNAEQFDLKLGADRVDLVEENRPAVCCLEAAGAVLIRTRECAFDVSEQFAFQQAFGQRAAVDANEGAGPARTEQVDGSGDEFLARARLAGQKHRRGTCCDPPREVVNSPHLRAVADHPCKICLVVRQAHSTSRKGIAPGRRGSPREGAS